MNVPPETEDRFFNFTPETLEAIREYRRTRDPALVDTVLRGILEKYLPENIRPAEIAAAEIAGAPVESSLNAFGLESLTLIEVILDLQDALGITLTDDELRSLHSLDEVRALLMQKVAALREVR